jgi:hypothetical protein
MLFSEFQPVLAFGLLSLKVPNPATVTSSIFLVLLWRRQNKIRSQNGGSLILRKGFGKID